MEALGVRFSPCLLTVLPYKWTSHPRKAKIPQSPAFSSISLSRACSPGLQRSVTDRRPPTCRWTRSTAPSRGRIEAVAGGVYASLTTDLQLVAWAVEQGASVSKLGVATVDPTSVEAEAGEGSQRGLVATADIAEGETVIVMPLELALSDALPPGSPPPYPDAPWHIRLAVRLLQERAKFDSSRWAPYVDSLPMEKVQLPIFFTHQEKRQVQYWRAEAAMHELAWIVSDAFDLIPAEQLADGSREDFEWAASMALSRSLRVLRAEGGRVSTQRLLLPLVDCLNHSFENQLEWRLNEARQAVEVFAVKPIQRGQQAFLSYGPYPNDHYFLYHGFYNVSPENPYRQVVIFKDVEEAIEWHAEKYGVPGADLADPERAWEAAWVQLCRNVEEAFAAAAPEAQILDTDPGGRIAEQQEAAKVVVFADGGVDARVVAAYEVLAAAHAAAGGARVPALAAIRRRCEELLSLVVTSAEEDRELLGALEADEGRLELVVRLRLGKKVMLQAAIAKIGGSA